MRRFEFVEGTSSKFWVPELRGSTFIVTYGRIGTEGQRKEKEFPTEEAARREYERKVAEKLREGYKEVSAAEEEKPAARSEGGKKGKGAPKLALPPRVPAVKPTAERLAATARALGTLESHLGQRSWKVAREARQVRRALRGLGGVDPASHPELGPRFTSLMERVVAPRGTPRLPLWLAMGLLAEVDAAAFSRALQTWKRASAESPASKAAATLGQQAEGLAHPELALRVGLLLAEKPGARGPSEEGWKRRWEALRPHLEAHLENKELALSAWLRTLESDDAHVSTRVARMEP